MDIVAWNFRLWFNHFIHRLSTNCLYQPYASTYFYEVFGICELSSCDDSSGWISSFPPCPTSYCGKYTNTKCTILIIFTHTIQWHFKYIHIAVQLSSPSIFRTFSSSQNETLYSLNSNSPFPFFQTLVTTIPLFVSMNLTTLGNSCK